MQYAIEHGADMVEFDVQVISNAWTSKLIQTKMLQLSRDEQPCVYHEFHLCVLTKAKQGHDVMVDVPVKVNFKFWIFKISALKDLSLAELQGLKSHHPSEKVAGVKVSSG